MRVAGVILAAVATGAAASSFVGAASGEPTAGWLVPLLVALGVGSVGFVLFICGSATARLDADARARAAWDHTPCPYALDDRTDDGAHRVHCRLLH